MKKIIYSTLFFLLFVLSANILAQKTFAYLELMNDPSFNEKQDFSKNSIPSLISNPDYAFESFTLSEFHKGALQILMNNKEIGNVEINIYNSNGSLIKKSFHYKNATSFSVTVPVSVIAAGIYVVNIRLNNYSYNKKAVNYIE